MLAKHKEKEKKDLLGSQEARNGKNLKQRDM